MLISQKQYIFLLFRKLLIIFAVLFLELLINNKFLAMYAIVEIAGQQFKVEKDQRLFVHRLDAKEGDKIDFDKVLLTDNKGKVNVGAPAIDGAKISAKVERHLKGNKVIVFKKKRRKGYQKQNGHRQYLTELVITDIKA